MSLTSEEIYDLDTFTLEEKIEELEALPDKHLYSLVLHLAKLELLDRLEAEDFAMKLCDIDFSSPQVQPPPPPPDPFPTKTIFAFKKHKPNPTPVSTRKQPEHQCVRIGRSAASRQFLPIKLKKANPVPIRKVQRAKTLQPLKKSSLNKPPTAQINSATKLTPQYFPPKEEEPTRNALLKQKLQREIQNDAVEYRQNDAYDDLLSFHIVPVRLEEIEKQIEKQILENERIHTEIDAPEQAKERIIVANEQSFLSACIEEQIILEEDTAQISLHEPPAPTLIDRPSALAASINTFVQLKQISPIEQISIGEIKVTPVESHESCENPPIQKALAEVRVRSLKSLSVTNRRTYTKATGIQKEVQFFAARVDPNEPKKKEVPHIFKQSLSCFSTLKISESRYPYHQTVASFAKLFPHSKDLLATLYRVETCLQTHIEKEIQDMSQQDDYLRLNEDAMLFKTVSESQKATRYRSLFDIDVQSFHRRGAILMERISRKHSSQSQVMLYRVVKTREDVYNIITNAFFRTPNWFELPHGMDAKGSWNLLWTWSKPQINFEELIYFQKVNHFLGNKQLARKDLLKKNIERIKKLGDRMRNLFDIIPQTYLLPGENIKFIRKFKELSHLTQNYWIMKPVGLSRGRGISLVSKLQEVVFAEPVVMQRYLSDPLLIDGFKFDMRIYVLVNSINPLEAYVYKQGFARISTEAYSLSEEQLDNKFVHLTNFSIQKQHVINQEQTFEEKIGGCKISLRMLREKLSCKGIEWSGIEQQIDQIVLKALIACMNSIPQNPNCFELFGYDIFIDSKLKCWLIEVNSSPSLEKDYFLDEVIKQELINDIIDIVDPLHYDRARLLEVITRKKKELQGLKSHINTHINSHGQLDEDLHYILHGQPLRRDPHVQNFRQVAPGEKYQQILKAVQKYKIDPLERPY